MPAKVENKPEAKKNEKPEKKVESSKTEKSVAKKPTDKLQKDAAKEKVLPAVPESKLKFAKKQVSKRMLETRRKLKRAAVIALRRRENLVRAEKYQNEYLKAERREIKLRRLAKAKNQYYVPAEAKLAFVIRIRGYIEIYLLHYTLHKSLTIR